MLVVNYVVKILSNHASMPKSYLLRETDFLRGREKKEKRKKKNIQNANGPQFPEWSLNASKISLKKVTHCLPDLVNDKWRDRYSLVNLIW